MSKYVELEDVIQRLDNAIYEANRGAIGYYEALRRLRIAYDETMPTIEVSEDCISRKWLEENKQVVSHTNEWGETEINEYVCWEDVEDAPSVVSDFKTFCGVPIEEAIDVLERYTTEQSSMVGEWQITEAYPHNVYCSKCHKRFAQTHWAVWEDGSLPRKYCPNCGAKNKTFSRKSDKIGI